MFTNEFHLLLEIIRQPEIISIKKSDELSARGLQSRVARDARAPVFLFQINNSVEVRLNRPLKINRVRRAVVHYDHFIASKRLRENRIKRLSDVRRNVVSGDDDADLRN